MRKGFGITLLSLLIGVFAQAEELVTTCQAQNRTVEIYSTGAQQYLVKISDSKPGQASKERLAQGSVSAKAISVDLFHQDPQDPYNRSVASGNLTAFLNKTKNVLEGTLYYQNRSIPLTCPPLR